jgi:hypothetical protein
MTAAVTYRASWAARFGRRALDLVLGTLLTVQAIPSILVLGWLTRRMGWIIRRRLGLATDDAPGWLFGARERGRMARALGGLAANIRAGAITLVALFAWTLPFTALWLGAWWAGWENSFNKGYEQAFVGPSVYWLGMLIAMVILPALPIVLAHLAAEDRLSAAFELRRIRAVMAEAGVRLAGLAALSTLLALPLFAARGLISLGSDAFPGLEDMTPEAAISLRNWLQLGFAACAFAALWVLRGLAARLYAYAAPRAAALRPGLWDGTLASEAASPARPRARWMVAVWVALAMVFAWGLAALVLMGQFLDYAWWRWLMHPLYTLPWPG